VCVTNAYILALVTHTESLFTKALHGWEPSRRSAKPSHTMQQPLDLMNVPTEVQLLRIQMLSEALETLISDVWERHQGDRLLSRAAVVPTATIENGVLIVGSRAVAIAPTEELRQQMRQGEAA
jgi:hypothetical protein